MYTLIITLHSLIRWITILLGLVALGRAIVGLSGNRPWSEVEAKAGRLFTVSLDVQLLLGLLLYLFVSPITTGAFANMGGTMQNSAVRYWVVEHPFMMVLALVVAHIGTARVRRSPTPVLKRRRAAIFYGVAFLLVLAGTPWPFMPSGRPLLPLG